MEKRTRMPYDNETRRHHKMQ